MKRDRETASSRWSVVERREETKLGMCLKRAEQLGKGGGGAEGDSFLFSPWGVLAGAAGRTPWPRSCQGECGRAQCVPTATQQGRLSHDVRSPGASAVTGVQVSSDQVERAPGGSLGGTLAATGEVGQFSQIRASQAHFLPTGIRQNLCLLLQLSSSMNHFASFLVCT